MAVYSSTSINAAVLNAEDVVDKIKNGEVIYSFFMGGTERETINSNSEEKRKDAWKNAAFFKKMDPTSIDIVVRKNDFGAKPFNTWSSGSDVLSNFYCYHQGNVYLVIGNNGNNTTARYGQVSPSTNTPPTHTFGIEKYGEYEFLFLFSVQTQDSLVLSGNLYIPVPKTSASLDYYSGSLIEKKINIDALGDSLISTENPVIPILSDTGGDASITLVTELVSAPGTTTSKKKYRVVGINASPGRGYEEYDLDSSIDEALATESASVRTALKSAITIGFTPIRSSVRQIVQANQTLTTIAVTSTEIASVSDQTAFFTHGIIRDVQDTGGNALFKSTDTGTAALKSNNVKIETSDTALFESDASSAVGTVNQILTIQTTTVKSNQNGKIASSKTIPGSKIRTEVQIHKNRYATTQTVKAGKSGAVFVITGVTEPEAKEGTGIVVNTGDTEYRVPGSDEEGDHFPKTFIVQYINRYN